MGNADLDCCHTVYGAFELRKKETFAKRRNPFAQKSANGVDARPYAWTSESFSTRILRKCL